ncbi:hypothetical protein F4782DRAFT_524227 [Xylaria castorea]|nr:hypothetical protein F4782DRAFT_524227 [Xylaria castorea]
MRDSIYNSAPHGGYISVTSISSTTFISTLPYNIIINKSLGTGSIYTTSSTHAPQSQLWGSEGEVVSKIAVSSTSGPTCHVLHQRQRSTTTHHQPAYLLFIWNEWHSINSTISLVVASSTVSGLDLADYCPQRVFRSLSAIRGYYSRCIALCNSWRTMQLALYFSLRKISSILQMMQDLLASTETMKPLL